MAAAVAAAAAVVEGVPWSLRAGFDVLNAASDYGGRVE